MSYTCSSLSRNLPRLSNLFAALDVLVPPQKGDGAVVLIHLVHVQLQHYPGGGQDCYRRDYNHREPAHFSAVRLNLALELFEVE